MSKGNSFRKRFLTFVFLVTAALFGASTMILFFGMLPTIAANVIDKTRQKSRAISVGMMNLSGVMPFLLELWMSPAPNSYEHAMAILLQPKTVVIMYSIAAAGYAIEAAVTGMVATILQQRAAARLKRIDFEVQELVERWNYYVDGETQLDDAGFPYPSDD